MAEEKLLETIGKPIKTIPFVRKMLEGPIGVEEETQGEDLEGDQ